VKHSTNLLTLRVARSLCGSWASCCLCVGHGHCSPGTESQGHRSRSKVNFNAVGLTSIRTEFLVRKLQSVQNAATCLDNVTSLHFTGFLSDDEWMTRLRAWRTVRCLSGHLLAYLEDDINLVSDSGRRLLRSLAERLDDVDIEEDWVFWRHSVQHLRHSAMLTLPLAVILQNSGADFLPMGFPWEINMWNYPRGLHGIPCEILHGFSLQTGVSFMIQTPWRLLDSLMYSTAHQDPEVRMQLFWHRVRAYRAMHMRRAVQIGQPKKLTERKNTWTVRIAIVIRWCTCTLDWLLEFTYLTADGESRSSTLVPNLRPSSRGNARIYCLGYR